SCGNNQQHDRCIHRIAQPGSVADTDSESNADTESVANPNPHAEPKSYANSHTNSKSIRLHTGDYGSYGVFSSWRQYCNFTGEVHRSGQVQPAHHCDADLH